MTETIKLNKYKTTFEDVEFILEPEQHQDYQDIHLFSRLELDEDDDLEHFDTYNVVITATYEDQELTFYLYGIFIEKQVDSLIEELGEILDQQNVFELIEKEIKKVHSESKNPPKSPPWG